MDYLDPAAPTCPHLHPHLHTYTHTHTHTHIHTHILLHTHLNTLLACEPQVTTMHTNSKEAPLSDNVSKQLKYDDDKTEDSGRLVKVNKEEEKKKTE